MKRSMFFGALFAAGMLMTACSSDKDVADNEGPNRLTENGEGYISIGISMPSDASARTRANDVFDDGDADEYEVSDAYLLLFSGADEANSKFSGIYQLNANPLSNHASDQITKEALVTTKINGSLLTGEYFYAYVILNQNGVIKDYDSSSPSTFTFVASDGDKSISTSTTFSTFSGYKLVASTIHNGSKKHFLMTNALVSKLRGGDYDPSSTGAGISTLAVLDKSKIYATKSEAETNPAGHVDVERAAVKVTVSCTATSLKGATSITFDFFGWALGNTNETYYNTRKWTSTASDWLKLKAETGDEGTPTAATHYRFVSKAYLDNGTTLSTTTMDQDRARTYWCEDPNYTGKSGLTNTTIAVGDYSNAGATSDYTTENTFDVAHMTFENTTYVAVNLKFNGGADFYTASTAGESEILQKSEDDGFTHSASAKSVKEYILKTYLSSRTDIQAYMTANGTDVEGYLDAFEITMTDNPTTGEAVIATFTPAAGKPTWAGAALPTVSDLNTAIKFKYFKDGQSYYAVRIKHFGAGGTIDPVTGKESGCETPWNSRIHSTNSVLGVYQQKVVSLTTTPYSEDEQNNNFLGRYGVVRNNWYDVNITSVRKIGSPIPLTPDDTPDDEIENYLSVKIHILSWAKRTQNADL